MPAVHFTQDDFDEKVLKAAIPVMVDFYADWCGPCKMAEPIINELAETHAGKVLIGKVNVDENNEIAGRFGVMSIPTVLMFKDGKEVDRKVGYGGRGGYEEMLEKVVG